MSTVVMSADLHIKNPKNDQYNCKVFFLQLMPSLVSGQVPRPSYLIATGLQLRCSLFNRMAAPLTRGTVIEVSDLNLCGQVAP